MSILFTDDAHIAELNGQYLGRQGPTDVMAFPMSEGPDRDTVSAMMGDVVISVDTAVQESEELNEPLEDTLYRLLIHGILHLLGFDHERSPSEAQKMEKEQSRLFHLIKED